MGSARGWIGGLVALLGVACASPARDAPQPSASVERPVVRDEAGAVVSRLVIPDGVASVTIPLVEEDGLLLTSAMRVNGRPIGWVAVDTGAGFSALDRETANALGLKPEQRIAGGRTVEPPDGYYRIRSLAVGELSIDNHAIVVADLSSLRRPDRRAIVGVIGGAVFGAVPFTVD
jgi:hypothetical protein